jgi:isopentenyl-diphosphate delta-isomerase
MNVANSMVEHELNQVFVGRFDGSPQPDLSEVDECRWVGLAELRSSIQASPEIYTPWLKLLLETRDWAAVDEILSERL